MTTLQTASRMSNLQKAWAKNKEKQQNIKEVKMDDKTTLKDIGVRPEKPLVVLEENTPIVDSQPVLPDPKVTAPVNTPPKVKKGVYEKYSKYVFDLCKDLFYYFLYAAIFYVGGLYLETARKHYQSHTQSTTHRITGDDMDNNNKETSGRGSDRHIEPIPRNDHLFSSSNSNNLFQ